MDGWIILDKPVGVFSKTAAGRVARIFETKKNGHIGTLDPMASGVLPVAIGNATKMIPFLEELSPQKKEYMFSVQFGFETDSLDITGIETARTDEFPTEQDIKNAIPQFIGEISQTPPIFSAVHVNGVRAYKLARSGQMPEIAPRKVIIYDLKLLNFDGKSASFIMSCAPGTYVRSVARDIAHMCGSLCTVDMIRRTETGFFSIKNAVTLDFLENMVNNGTRPDEYLGAVDSGLGGIPVLNLPDKAVCLYKNGGFINTGGADGLRRVYSDNVFIGIGVVESGVLRPKRTI